MAVKLEQPLYAVRPGCVYPEWIAAGEEVDGDLELAARELGLVSKSMKRAPENK